MPNDARADKGSVTFRYFLITSNHWFARVVRKVYFRSSFSLPVPRLFAKSFLLVFRLIRSLTNWLLRVFVAEPLFKAYCQKYGRNLHTDKFIHWVEGTGDIIVGDDVLFDGKSSISFAARFSARPTLTVGNGTGIGHACILTIGKSISIGNNCRIAQGVWMFDSTGHSSDPQARLADSPPLDSDVKPIVIEDNVWIGGRAVIFPGVKIGEGSIVSACAVVTSDVAAYSIVAGNPARRVGTLSPPEAGRK